MSAQAFLGLDPGDELVAQLPRAMIAHKVIALVGGAGKARFQFARKPLRSAAVSTVRVVRAPIHDLNAIQVRRRRGFGHVDDGHAATRATEWVPERLVPDFCGREPAGAVGSGLQLRIAVASMASR
jgi:hypothetical protein